MQIKSATGAVARGVRSGSALAGALLAVALAPATVWAADEKPADAPGCLRGVDLITPREMQAHHAAMELATSQDEKQALMNGLMVRMRERASEKGKPLCHDAMGGAGMGHGMGAGGAMHGQGMGAPAPSAPQPPAQDE